MSKPWEGVKCKIGAALRKLLLERADRKGKVVPGDRLGGDLFDTLAASIEPEVDEPPRERYETTTRLNIRGGPGTDFEKLDESPLAAGAVLERLDEDGPWMKVSVAGEGGLIGWVHGSYLRLV